MYEIRKIPKSDIPQVLEIYAQGIEGGHSTFNTEVPTAEVGINPIWKFAVSAHTTEIYF